MHAPLLRWAGSKKRSLPDILPVLPTSYDRYLEPFAGSACLFFLLAPTSGVVSDNNIELMQFYKTVRRRAAAVYKEFVSIRRDRDTYYAVRRNYEMQTDPVMRAATFLYLNRNCFNGIYRTNLRGAFNVPFSGDRVLVLIGLQYFGKLAVWRVARHDQPLNARPSGTYIRSAIDLESPSSGLDFSILREMLEESALRRNR